EIQKLRTFDEKRYIFEKYIFKPLGSLPITEIKRSNIVRMLRNIKQHNGPGSANNVYKVLSAFFNWYIPKADDDFHSPIVRGVFNQSKGDGARTLTDDEIRILWNVASKGRNPYDQFLQFTLLPATALSDSANMTRSELSPDGMEWTIPESRYKGQSGKGAHAHLIPLSPLARNVLDSVKVLQVGGKDSQWVFTRDGARPITGFSNFKHSFDRRLFKQLEQEGDDTRNRIVAALNERYPGKNYEPFDDRWTTHSLRKTARTLLDRLGIPESTSEKCLGHLRRGLVKTYNHHEAKPEKKIAFETLAREVERIVSKGGKDNVIRLARGVKCLDVTAFDPNRRKRCWQKKARVSEKPTLADQRIDKNLANRARNTHGAVRH